MSVHSKSREVLITITDLRDGGKEPAVLGAGGCAGLPQSQHAGPGLITSEAWLALFH